MTWNFILELRKLVIGNLTAKFQLKNLKWIPVDVNLHWVFMKNFHGG